MVSKFSKSTQFITLSLPKEIEKYSSNLDFKINYFFGTFKRPDNLDNNALNIILDHSFEPLENDYVMFIDHHLVEQNVQNDVITDPTIVKNYVEYCCSNSNLMYKIYDSIINEISKLKFESVNVYMHSDLDGIASGLIMRQILEDVKKGTNSKENVLLAMILGNYGDLYPEAKYDLADIFVEAKDIAVFDKKLKTIVKYFGRFMKTIKPSLDYMFCKQEKYLTSEVRAFAKHIKSIDLEFNDVKEYFMQYLVNPIVTMNKVDTIQIVSFLNNLTNHSIYKILNDDFQKTIDSISKEYIEPSYPQIELAVVFKADPTATVYKLIFADSPYDCGRSLIWKYRVAYKALQRNTVINDNKWNYKATDWKHRDMHKAMNNMACYNKCLSKLTLDGTNESAFSIATKYSTAGGGHCGTSSEGEGSIGSVIVPEEEFMNSFVVKDFF